MNRLVVLLAIVLAVPLCLPLMGQAQTKDFFADPVLVDDIRRIGKRVALVVGIEYPDDPARILDYTVDDAVEIGWLLKQDYGFDVICAITEYPDDPAIKERAKGLRARVGAKYTNKAGLEGLFGELLGEASHSDDQVVVFISGHGLQSPDNPELGYIVPTGGNIETRFASMVDMNIFERLSRELKARHALFILDSCFSGIAAAFSDMGTADSARKTAEQVKRLMGSRSRQILTASDTWQKARMHSDTRMSAFSYWLKYALEREGGWVRADLTGDGVVTFGELYEYVYPKLNDQYEQRPRRYKLARADGQFVFAHINLDLSAKPSERVPQEWGTTTGPRPSGMQGSIRIIENNTSPASGPGGINFEVEPFGGVSLELVGIDTGYRKKFPRCPGAVHSLPPGTYRAILSSDLYKDKILDNVVVRPVDYTPVTVRLSPDFGRLVIKSEPEGALAYLRDIDGGREQRLGRTPVEKERQPSGRYRLRLDLDHYQTAEIDLAVIAEQTWDKTVKLEPDFGYLCVYTQPEGAEVLLDGNTIGQTPLGYYRLDSGEYYLTVRKDLHDPVRDEKLVMDPGNTERRTYSLKRNFFSLVLNGRPEGQSVYDETGSLLGRFPGEIRLKPGRHAIRIGEDRDDSPWLPFRFEGDFPKGGARTMDVVLERNTGVLRVTAEPDIEGARIYIDGETRSDWKTPTFIRDVPVGEREVKCVDPKTGESGIVRVVVFSKKTADAAVKIGRGSVPTGGVVESSVVQGMTFVFIPPGEFTMGSPDGEKGRRESESPQHRVKIQKGFYLQTTEVTQGQWRKIMGGNPSHFKNCGEDCPVEQVSWEDAQRFIEKLNRLDGKLKYRLPSEAEWEYAARAGSTTAFANGDITDTVCDDPNMDAMGWYCGNAGRTTHRVGQKKKNDWGLYDMHGNVYEWVEDQWHGNYNGAPKDGSAWVDKQSSAVRVLRGGSWFWSARFCRSAFRDGGGPGFCGFNVGLRLAALSK